MIVAPPDATVAQVGKPDAKVRTYPFVPGVSSVVLPAAVWYGTEPATPPAIFVAVVADVEVVALPVNAPIKVVEVNELTPAIVVAVEPSAIAVDPMVIVVLASAAIGILVIFAPEIAGAFVHAGVAPDTSTWLEVPVANNEVTLTAD